MRLKELRTSRNLLQKELAETLGVDRTTYSKYESGSSEPNYETLIKLAEFFDVSTDYLLGRTDEKGEKQPTPKTEGGLSETDQRLNELLAQASEETKQAMLVLLEQNKKQK